MDSSSAMTGLPEPFPPTAHPHDDTSTLPPCLNRATVPAYFPQFRSTATLAYLAHRGRGPRYLLVGGQAWYEISDIRMWLEQNKRIGPGLTVKEGQNRGPVPLSKTTGKKRGRPTKAEQKSRRGLL